MEKLAQQVKAPTTIAPHLDKVYANLCSKSTKQADRALVCLQALTMDAMGLLWETVEMINGKEDTVELDLDKLGAALKAAMIFFGNASTQAANLRRQKIMEGINKDLVPFTV